MKADEIKKTDNTTEVAQLSDEALDQVTGGMTMNVKLDGHIHIPVITPEANFTHIVWH